MFSLPKIRNFFWIILLPLSWAWATVSLIRRKWITTYGGYTSTLPVISVGNLHSGGSGKTPVVIEIAKRIAKSEIVVLSRGYKGRLSSEGAWVKEIAKGPLFFGDEAWMMKKMLPPEVSVYIDRDRVRAVRKIEKEKPNAVVILDDGFQHIQLKRQLNILVISTAKKIEDSVCLPLGELREPWKAAHWADLVLLTSHNREDAGFAVWRDFFKKLPYQKPLFQAVLKVEAQTDRKRVYAVSGIADPHRFVDTVKRFHEYVGGYFFRDHHEYHFSEVVSVIAEGKSKKAEAYITTEKDYYKLIELWPSSAPPLLRLRVGYEIDEEFWNFLHSKLNK